MQRNGRGREEWYFVSKIVLTYHEKELGGFFDGEKLLKFKDEDRQFAKFLRSLEQFV